MKEVLLPTYRELNRDSISTVLASRKFRLLNPEDQGRYSGKGATILGLFGIKGTPRTISRRSSHNGVHIASGVEEMSSPQTRRNKGIIAV